jgi:4-diphosphocytidyl-2-C-methyl-D-erythritol kinase
LPETALLLGCPPFGVSTREVFARVGAARFGERERAAEEWTNDLEPIVYAGWPELGRFRAALAAAGARVALLSGSGSTVFGVFEDTDAVRWAADRLAAGFPGWRPVPTRTVQAAAGAPC